MTALTSDALDHHNLLQDSPITRVTIRLMSGDQVGWYELGEKPETLLTFPGAFTVGEILHDEYKTWVRKARHGDDRNDILTRTLHSGEKIEFVQVSDIKALILDSHRVAGLEQRIGTLNQTEILGVSTEAAIPLERTNIDDNPIDLSDIQPTSRGSSVLSDRVSSDRRLRLVEIASLTSSLASHEWYPDESMASDEPISV